VLVAPLRGQPDPVLTVRLQSGEAWILSS
jgi:hypothetical protein